MNHNADYYIRHLAMEEHVEGGYCKEIYQNRITLHQAGGDSPKKRCLSSTIYYLLKSGQVSKFHRLQSDEIWFFHDGSTLLVHMIDNRGELTTARLGMDVSSGELPQVLVPAGTVFGAEVAVDGSFTLVSCMVSPGFDYDDFQLYTYGELLALYPAHSTLISRFYR